MRAMYYLYYLDERRKVSSKYFLSFHSLLELFCFTFDDDVNQLEVTSCPE